jgi:phosphoadenosine phosphosulfate reductase
MHDKIWWIKQISALEEPELSDATDLAALVASLDEEWTGLAPADRLASLRAAISGRVVFTTSFGAEDQALTHLIAESGLEIALVTLDTGRLFPETYDVWAETERRYGIRIGSVHPNQAALEELVASQGIDGFRHSQEARHACCGVRKLVPLRRALAGAAGWVTGLRADQSANRQDVPFVGLDSAHGVVKANPLRDWSRDQVTGFIAAHGVPINVLHARGFVSIGCAPCTRAIAPGEPERAGRWWWEQESAKECGLHVTPDGRLVRAEMSVVA